MNDVTINYVVAVYISDGVCRNNLYHRIDKYFAVKYHIDVLNVNRGIYPLIVKITFVVNKSEHVQEGEIESIIESRNSKKIPIEVKYRDNFGLSYGAWEHHIRESLHENYDYYFLTEDDYVPNLLYAGAFYDPFIEKSDDKTAFVCGLWTTHPSVLYGLYNAKICKHVLESNGEIIPRYNQKSQECRQEIISYQEFYHLNFLKSGYQIIDTTDKVPTIFRRNSYGVNGSPPILPLI